MKFAVKSLTSEKYYGPFSTTDAAIRWAKKEISGGIYIIPLRHVIAPRKPIRRRRK